MKYEIVSHTHAATHERVEAIGAHDGYRLRLVARPDRLSSRYAVDVAVRGSESEEEVALEAAGLRASSPEEALELGHACAVAWIDQQDVSAR